MKTYTKHTSSLLLLLSILTQIRRPFSKKYLEEDPEFLEFSQFARFHSKNYASLGEMQYRFFVFARNKESIRRQNQVYKARGWDLRLRVNRFGDLSVKEISSLLLTKTPFRTSTNPSPQ